jgi:hypothetical protein
MSTECGIIEGMDTRALVINALGDHLQEKIRYGDPTIGWSGDPWLTLSHNKLEDRYQIWVEDPGRPAVLVMQTSPLYEMDHPPSIEELCIKLRDHDLRKISMEKIMQRVDDHNAAVEKAAQEKGFQAQAAAMEKAAWYVGREVGEYRPVIGGFNAGS